MISQHWRKAVRKKTEENLREKVGERMIGGKFEEKLEGGLRALQKLKSATVQWREGSE